MSRNATRLITKDNANYLFINSESESVSGNNYSFNVDLSNTPLLKNKGYYFYLKQIYVPSSLPQITSLYNYNKFTVQYINRTTQAVVFTGVVEIPEGTYSSSQYLSVVARVLNALILANTATYGQDTYTFGYDDILNKFYFYRNSVTLKNGVYYDMRILSNDTLAKWNNMTNFGGSYILGLNENSFLNLPTILGNIQNPSGTYVYCPNAPTLTPYQYIYIACRQVNNINYCSDIETRNDIIYRMPLNIQETQKYMFMFVEEASEEFQKMNISTLGNILTFDILDQFGNYVQFPSNSAVDLTVKLVQKDE